jgi:hypothetical protein
VRHELFFISIIKRGMKNGDLRGCMTLFDFNRKIRFTAHMCLLKIRDFPSWFFVLPRTDFPHLSSVLLPVGFDFTGAPGLVHSRSDPVCCFVFPALDLWVAKS